MARPQQISTETITQALNARPEATAADLAESLGIGQSTASKRLAALEAAGSVRRTPGGRVAGVRVADRWSVTSPPDTAAPGTAAPGAGKPGTGVTETAAPETAEPKSAAHEPVVAEDGGGRLARGELGTLVREYLAARPGEDFGPSAVGEALGRSQGAVSNSLATMAARGEVDLVGDKPRRYRIAS
jgi:DNA-binding transcriptional ArsR family regulator